MPTLTSKDITKLADNFLAIAQSVGDYRMNASGLTGDQKASLRDLHASLLNYSNDLYVASANLVMDEVESSMKAISEVTEEIKSTYAKLRNIQKAINVAAAAVTLAAAVLTKSPKSIGTAIGGLVKTWKKDAAKDDA